MKQAAEGNRAAQFSQGCRLVGDRAGLSGAAGRRPQVEVGLAHKRNFRSLTRPTRVAVLLSTDVYVYSANPTRRRAWRFWRRRRGEGTRTRCLRLEIFMT